MFLLTFVRKLYKTLSRDASPFAIAAAASFGVLAGCVPPTSGVGLFLLLCVLVFRVQISTALFAWALTRMTCLAGLAFLFSGTGEALLDAEALHGFWTWFFTRIPFTAWSGLDRYAILGGVVVGCVLALLVFFPVRFLVIAYRRWAHEKLAGNRFFRWLTSFWFVKLLKFVFVGSSL